MSVNYDVIPEHIKVTGQRTYRSITVDGEEIEFSSGFTELHTKSYEQILNGNGFSLYEALPSIEIVHDMFFSLFLTPINDQIYAMLI